MSFLKHACLNTAEYLHAYAGLMVAGHMPSHFATQNLHCRYALQKEGHIGLDFDL